MRTKAMATPLDGEPFLAGELFGISGDKHFGSVTLERVLPASLGSEASLTVDDEAVEYKLLLPPDSFHAN